MIIVLLGPPASGKGTLAQTLVEKHHWKTFSAGQAIRDMAARGGKKGAVLEHYLNTGKLVPDAMVSDIEDDFFRRNKSRNILLDGTPRNIEQARDLLRSMKKHKLEFTAFFFFDASEAVSWKRIRSRLQCKDCHRIYGLQIKPKKKGICDKCGGKLIRRKDDSKKVLHERYRVYKKETLPLVEWAAQRYPVFYINANRSPQSALKQAKTALEILH